MVKKHFWILIFAILCLTIVAEATTLVCKLEDIDSFVNIRERPDISSGVSGRLFHDDEIEVDGFKGNWAHSSTLSTEAGKGWISMDYLYAKDTPEAGEYEPLNGRVAIRKELGGKRIGWLKPGKSIMVNGFIFDEDGTLWAKTNKGFLNAEHIEAVE